MFVSTPCVGDSAAARSSTSMDASSNYGAVRSDAAGAGGKSSPSNPEDISNSTSGAREEKMGSAIGEGTESTQLLPMASVEKNAPGQNKPLISTRMAIFLVVNYMIGSGILNTPQTFRDSGIAATTVLYTLACEFAGTLCVSTGTGKWVRCLRVRRYQ